MDGKSLFLDIVFVRRLWRSMKYECVDPPVGQGCSPPLSGPGEEEEEVALLRPLMESSAA